MLALPVSTEVKRILAKTHLFRKGNWNQKQIDKFNKDIECLTFVNWLSPSTLPAISIGKEIKEIFVIEVKLKNRDFDLMNISLLAKSIPQHIIYILRHNNEIRIAVYHTKLFITDAQDINIANLPLNGLNIDAIWENIVSTVGNFSLDHEKSLSEQIKLDDEKQTIIHKLEKLEYQMRSTSQARRQRELYSEIKKLKSLLSKKELE